LVLKLLAVSLPFYTNMLISLSSTQAFHTLKYRVYVENFMNPTLNAILFLFLFLLGWKLESVTAAYVLSFIVCAVLAFFYLKKLFPEILDAKIKPIFESKKLLKFSQPLLFIGFLNVIMMWTDSLMLGYFKSGVEVGIYNTAVKTAFFINFIIISFTSIFAPTISELYDKKKIKLLESLFKIITKWILALCLPIFLAIVLLSKNILLLFGNQFVSGYISLTILSVAHLINSAVGSVQYMLMMSEREKMALYITFGVCVLNFILNLILVPKYGINGAALATGTSIVVLNIIMLIDVYKHLGIHPYNLKYIKPLLAGLVVAGLGIILRKYLQASNHLLYLPIHVTIYFIIYFLGLKVLKFDEQDQLILHTIRLKFGRN
ncbi:MAG: flippase, partial [Candidatus Hodarchaeota archaeon]